MVVPTSLIIRQVVSSRPNGRASGSAAGAKIARPLTAPAIQGVMGLITIARRSAPRQDLDVHLGRDIAFLALSTSAHRAAEMSAARRSNSSCVSAELMTFRVNSSCRRLNGEFYR